MPVYVDQTVSRYCMRTSVTSGWEATTGVLGVILPTSTSQRPSPPQPFNGFQTGGTPFGSGHLFALSLGGSDDRHNLVPQWEQWQQTGAWRAEERILSVYHRGRLFRCDVVYQAVDTTEYEGTKEAFASGDRLIPWSDGRLPSSFHVRTYDVAPFQTDFDKVSTENDFDTLAAKLDKAQPNYDSGVLDHTVMPAGDVAYWRGQIYAGEIRDLHKDFLEQEQDRIEAAGQVFQRGISLSDFIQNAAAKTALQARLPLYSGFTPTDIQGLQMQHVHRATIAQPQPRRRKGGKSSAKPKPAFTISQVNPSSFTVARPMNDRELRAVGLAAKRRRLF